MLHLAILSAVRTCMDSSGAPDKATLGGSYSACSWINDQYRYAFFEKMVVDDFTALTIKDGA